LQVTLGGRVRWASAFGGGDTPMATALEDRQVLAAAKTWRATPDNYSSLRALWLNPDGSGELVYGYGQTIYVVAPCGWEVPAAGRLRLTYAAPTRGRLAAGFALTESNRVKELSFTLTAGRVAGVEDIVSNPYEFDHTLELSAPPWPDGLALPYEVPRVFYGRADEASAADAEPGAAPDPDHV
jgi:hypothetical protein